MAESRPFAQKATEFDKQHLCILALNFLDRQRIFHINVRLIVDIAAIYAKGIYYQ